MPLERPKPRGRRAVARVALGLLAVALALPVLGAVAAAEGSITPAPSRQTATAAAARGTLVANRTTAIGDSVLLDYATPLRRDLPDTVVEAAVGRQWSEGLAEVRALRGLGALGTTVIIDLGTNGPVSRPQVQEMLATLAGVPRVVFVTVWVDRPWQGEVNSMLRVGAAARRDVTVADWAALAARHPSWLYSDGTHLPEGGVGANALAALVASAAGARLPG